VSSVDNVPNRAERRRQQRAEGGSYRVPDGTVYDEFVGELRPPNDRAFTELHVRYGVKNNQYVDWSLTLRGRLGGVEEFRDSPDGPLERRTLEVVDVSASAIRRHVYNPHEPEEPPMTAVVLPLHAGDYAQVDQQYMLQLNGLAQGWARRHGAAAASSRHNTALWGFVQENRRPAMRTGDLSWVRNTLICVEDDLADAVLSERSGYYFPTVRSAQGVLRSTGRMQFIIATPGGRRTPEEVQAVHDAAFDGGNPTATGQLTMGMLVDSIYAGDWTGEIDDFLGGR
jgi:hypothetical protein